MEVEVVRETVWPAVREAMVETVIRACESERRGDEAISLDLAVLSLLAHRAAASLACVRVRYLISRSRDSSHRRIDMGRGRRGGGGGSRRQQHQHESSEPLDSDSAPIDVHQHHDDANGDGDGDGTGESVAAMQERHKRERKALKKRTDKMVSTSLRSRKVSDPAHQAVLAQVAELEAELAATHSSELERANNTAAESARSLDAGLEALLASVPVEPEASAPAAPAASAPSSQAAAVASSTDALSAMLLQAATPSGPTAKQLKLLRKKVSGAGAAILASKLARSLTRSLHATPRHDAGAQEGARTRGAAPSRRAGRLGV